MDLFKKTVKRFFRDHYYDRAAQTAYYFLVSVIPFLIFMLSLVSYLPVNPDAVLNFIEPFAPGETLSLIEENVTDILSAGKGGILSISLIGAFWVGSMAVQSLARTLNAAYGAPSKLPFLKGLARDLGITLLFMFIIPVSLFLPFIEQSLKWAADYTGIFEEFTGTIYIWRTVKWGLGSIFIFLFFLVFYRIVPNQPTRIRSVLPGAILSTVAWQGASLLFGYYTESVSYSRLYGQLAGIIVLVGWFYLTATIVLFSGLLNAEYLRRRQERRFHARLETREPAD
ncbi:YihY/virulence factor BrkB family protein [Indiicoccus explosivorum]|uniref:YihY/virulence factor BrkB family protein n=1 Tax=Indiicoccus explosivorum TaxID=1917864 RepID=UPI001F4EB3F6|nr:YihY/virulence factor BrkB family protein [Indiicoccus explosivorum]